MGEATLVVSDVPMCNSVSCGVMPCQLITLCGLPCHVMLCRAVLCCAMLQTGWPELSPGVGSFLVQVVRFIILLAQAVPISLYVSLETVKVAQCKVGLLEWDNCAFGVGGRMCLQAVPISLNLSGWRSARCGGESGAARDTFE
jgi:hypothetical protein